MNEPMSIVVCLPADTAPFDPGPDETKGRDVTLVDDWQDDTRGVVGWSSGAWRALALAAEHRSLPRLAIVSLPYPDDDRASMDLDAIAARTLLLYGSEDPQTGLSHGRRWQERLPNARLEMVPGGTHDLLIPMWRRVLSHLAPRRTLGR